MKSNFLFKEDTLKINFFFKYRNIAIGIYEPHGPLWTSSVQRYSPGKNAIPGDLHNPGIEPRSVALQADCKLRGKAPVYPISQCLFAVCELGGSPHPVPSRGEACWGEQR